MNLDPGSPFQCSLRQRLALAFSGGSLLFLANNLAILNGFLHTPAGFFPAWIHRNGDTELYLTWINGLRYQSAIPNYHVPWQTDPGLFTVFAAILARIANFTGLPANQLLLSSHLLLYCLAVFALIRCLEVFTESKMQAALALLVSLCVLPIQSYLQLARNLLLHDMSRTGGMDDFVIASSDGFFHGIAASPIVTFGTAVSLLALSQIGIYLRTNRATALYATSAIAFTGALVHPFEVWVILGASVASLVLVRERPWQRIFRDAAILCIPSALALLPYIRQVLRYDWIREVSARNHWHPGSPVHLLSILGLPALFVLLAGKIFLDQRDKRLLPLKCWFAVTLIAVYLPPLPWTQHLLDGFHYVTALLLVGMASTSGLLKRAFYSHPRLTRAFLAAWLLVSLIPHVQYRVISYVNGARPRPELLFSTVISRDNLAGREWMRAHASRSDVVLAPPDRAGWFASAPMHSFASHWLFGMSHPQQSLFTRRFYAGSLPAPMVADALPALGIRFVIVPTGSSALSYVGSLPCRARFTDFAIYEVPGASIQPRQQVARQLTLATQ